MRFVWSIFAPSYTIKILKLSHFGSLNAFTLKIIFFCQDNVERAKQMVLEKIGAAPGSGYGAFPGQTFGGAQV